MKPMIENIMDKETMMRGTYEKARVAKHTAEYGVLCTVQCFTQNWLIRSSC